MCRPSCGCADSRTRLHMGGGGGVTQDVGSGTIGLKKCGKWDYRVKKCGKWDYHFNVGLASFVEII